MSEKTTYEPVRVGDLVKVVGPIDRYDFDLRRIDQKVGMVFACNEHWITLTFGPDIRIEHSVPRDLIEVIYRRPDWPEFDSQSYASGYWSEH